MTVKEASEAVGMKYDSLAELLRKYSSVRLWLGAWREKGAWVYSDRVLPQFEWIAARHAEGWTLAAIAKGAEQMGSEQSANALTPLEQLPDPIAQITPVNEQTMQAFADLLRDAMITANDNLLTLKKAKEEYPNIPLEVLRSLRVTVGQRRYIRRGDVLRWIQQL